MAQIVDHRDLISSFQPGDLSASERIVRVYQNEMVRTAFLLTGSPEGAVLLARDTFLNYFRLLVRGDASDDPRLGLIQQIGQRFMIGADDESENGDRSEGLLSGTITLAVDQQRYRVEDDRSRVISLLDLLDRSTRLGIVLREFNALEEEEVCQILDEVPFALRQRLHPTRDRIRDAAGVGSDYSVRELLVNSATAAPRPDLWPEVLGPLEDFYAEEDERRQRLTYLAAGLVGLLLLLAGLWLFDLLPFGGGDGAAAIAPTAGPTATPTATPEATITPTPIPALSSFAIPQGDVPGKFLMLVNENANTSGRNEFGLFDVDGADYTPLSSVGNPIPSPDGRLLIGFAVDGVGTIASKSHLVALDSATGELVWESESLDAGYSYIVTENRIFLVTGDASVSGEQQQLARELREYDLATGERTREWPNLIPSLQTGTGTITQVVLFASPDGGRLFIALEESGNDTSNVSTIKLASYSLPEMVLESSSSPSDSAVSRQFPPSFSFYDAHATPDGRFIYRVDIDKEIVQFRSSDSSEDLDLPIPFAQKRELDEDIDWITSNDGRYLYVLAMRRAEVAIVDLLARRVERIFALDFTDELSSEQDLFRSRMIEGVRPETIIRLSSDGRSLYLATTFDGSNTSGSIRKTFLWTADLSTWTVTRVQEIPDLILGLTDLNGRLIMTVASQSGDLGESNRILVADAATGETLSEYNGEGIARLGDGLLCHRAKRTLSIRIRTRRRDRPYRLR